MRSSHKIRWRHRILWRIITTMGSRMIKFRRKWLKTRYRERIMHVRHSTTTIILLRSMFAAFIMTTRLLFLFHNHHISFARMLFIIFLIEIFKSLSQRSYMNAINFSLNTICFLFLAWWFLLDCFFIVLVTLDFRCHKCTYSSALLSTSCFCYWKIINSLMSLLA